MTTIFGLGCADPIENLMEKYSESIYLLENNNAYCTAFYVGRGIYVTAKHCIVRQPDAWYILHKNDLEAEIKKPAVPVLLASDSDLALLRAPGYGGPELPIWDGDMIPVGRALMAVGYPGYNDRQLAFEVGRTFGLCTIGEDVMIHTPRLGFQGESGGPTFDLTTGQVVGVVSSLLEREMVIGLSGHQHHTLSFAVPYTKLLTLLAQLDLPEEPLDVRHP